MFPLRYFLNPRALIYPYSNIEIHLFQGTQTTLFPPTPLNICLPRNSIFKDKKTFFITHLRRHRSGLEMSSVDHERAGFIGRGWKWLKGSIVKCRDKVVEVARKTKKLGQDDPRRIIHSLKAGLAVSLVSLLYYFKPLYGGFGVSTMWAVLTVVVVFEFSVGKFTTSGASCFIYRSFNKENK